MVSQRLINNRVGRKVREHILFSEMLRCSTIALPRQSNKWKDVATITKPGTLDKITMGS